MERSAAQTRLRGAGFTRESMVECSLGRGYKRLRRKVVWASGRRPAGPGWISCLIATDFNILPFVRDAPDWPHVPVAPYSLRIGRTREAGRTVRTGRTPERTGSTCTDTGNVHVRGGARDKILNRRDPVEHRPAEYDHVANAACPLC